MKLVSWAIWEGCDEQSGNILPAQRLALCQGMTLELKMTQRHLERPGALHIHSQLDSFNRKKEKKPELRTTLSILTFMVPTWAGTGMRKQHQKREGN